MNIVLYDYSGYGVSTGKPSARGVYADLEAVVDWCVLEKKFEPNRIVLYGQSIGSAPTCGYAAKAGETRDAFVRRDEAFFETNHSKTFSTSSDATRDALRGKSNKVAAAPIDPADSKHATAQCLDP